MLVIIPCGKKKRVGRHPAGEMYLGAYHRACRRYASLLGGRVLILSAKYGLLRLEDEIESYELRMGDLGCVTAEQVRGQARALSLLLSKKVVALGGGDYTAICRAVWPSCKTPLAGLGGIGFHLKWLNQQVSNAKAAV